MRAVLLLIHATGLQAWIFSSVRKDRSDKCFRGRLLLLSPVEGIRNGQGCMCFVRVSGEERLHTFVSYFYSCVHVQARHHTAQMYHGNERFASKARGLAQNLADEAPASKVPERKFQFMVPHGVKSGDLIHILVPGSKKLEAIR